MILIASIVCFLFLFFLGLSITSIVRAEEDEYRSKVRDRLKNGNKAITNIVVERKERLSDLPFLDRWLRKLAIVRTIQIYIGQAGLDFSVGTFLLFSLCLGLFSFAIATMIKANLLVCVLILFSISTLPLAYIWLKRIQRVKQFSNRFPDAIDLIASSLRAGHSLQMAIETVAEDNRDILSTAFRLVLSEVEVGQNFEEALKGMLTRVDTPELRLFISAVILQHETGGNLAELLDNLEMVIRERQELKRELKSATAQAQLSGIVLSLLPVFVGIMVFMIHPEYILFFFRDAFGVKLLVGSIVGQMLGIFTITRIVNIEF